MGIKKMKQFKTLRERFKKTKTMKDIMRVHGRALKKAERSIWRKKSIMAVPDHNVPTSMRENGIKDPISKILPGSS